MLLQHLICCFLVFSFNVTFLFFLQFTFWNPLVGVSWRRFHLNLISPLIFCSLCMYTVGRGMGRWGGMTLEESCLNTICAALALHTRLHRTRLCTQEHKYTAHLRLHYQQSTDALIQRTCPSDLAWIMKRTWVLEKKQRNGVYFTQIQVYISSLKKTITITIYTYILFYLKWKPSLTLHERVWASWIPPVRPLGNAEMLQK